MLSTCPHAALHEPFAGGQTAHATALEVLRAAEELPEYKDPLTLNGMLRAYEGYLGGGQSTPARAEDFLDSYAIALTAGAEGESRSVLAGITEDGRLRSAMETGYRRGAELSRGKRLAQHLGSAGAAALEEHGYRYPEEFGAFYQAGQEGLSFPEAKRMAGVSGLGEVRKAVFTAAWEAGRKDGNDYEETSGYDLGFEDGSRYAVSDDGGQRAAGVGARGQARAVEEGAGGSESREGGRLRDRGAGHEGARTDLKKLGVASGTDAAQRVVRRERHDYGGEVITVSDRLEVYGADGKKTTVQAISTGKDVILRDGDPMYGQHRLHELEHVRQRSMTDEEITAAFKEKTKDLPDGKVRSILRAYALDYYGLYGEDSTTMGDLYREYLADRAAGISQKETDKAVRLPDERNAARDQRDGIRAMRSNQDGEKPAYAINREYAAELDAWAHAGMPEGERFELGSTGPVLQGLGAIESDIYINGDKVKTILQVHPEMTMAEIKKLPEILEDPVFVLKSKTRENSIVLIGTNRAKNEMPILTAVNLLPQESGFVLDDMQKVKSAYAKTDSKTKTAAERTLDFIKSSDVLFLDKKRATAILRRMGTGSPMNLLRSGYIGSIAYEDGFVKANGVPFSSIANEREENYSVSETERDETYRSAVESGDMETAQKMVEEAAKAAGYDSPMLYHGTKTFGFTEFDLAKMDDKRSIFATSKQEVAQTYSGAPGTRRISETARNIEAMNPKETVDALNDYAKRYGDGLDSKYTFVTPEEAAKISSNADAALNELSALVREKIAEYADRMAADFNEKDMKTQEQLVGLQEKLYLGDRYSILTPLYLLINHTDAFSGSKVAADALQKLTIEREVKKRILDTSNGFVLRDELGGYIYVPMTTEAAKDILRDYGSRGNYALVAKTGRTLEVNAAGQRWNELRNWTKGAEYDVKDTFIDKEGDRVYLLDRNTDDVITSTDLSGVKETLSDTSLHMLLLNKANSAMRVEAETIRDTRGISAWAARNGYDSVIFRNLIDSGGNADFESADTPSDVYIIFDPTSVKSADPVTYDNSGNVISLSERFNPRKRDIRYSVSEEAEPSSSAEYAQMQRGRAPAGPSAREAAEQRKRQVTLLSHMTERAFELRRQFTEGTQRDLRATDIPDVASDLLRFAGRKAMGRGELEQRLSDIAMKAVRSQNPMEAYQVAKEEADYLAADMIRNATGQTDEAKDMWDGIRQTLRSGGKPVKLAITGQSRADLEREGGYEHLRKRLMGYAFLSAGGTPVDVFYEQELTPRFPTAFPDTIQNPADQLIRIVEVLDRFRQIFKSPWAGDAAEDTELLSQERCLSFKKEWTGCEVPKGCIKMGMRAKYPSYFYNTLLQTQ